MRESRSSRWRLAREPVSCRPTDGARARSSSLVRPPRSTTSKETRAGGIAPSGMPSRLAAGLGARPAGAGASPLAEARGERARPRGARVSASLRSGRV